MCFPIRKIHSFFCSCVFVTAKIGCGSAIAKLEKLRFSFVSALAFRYLCTRYETEAYFFPIHLFVYGVSRHSTNACR